MIKVQHSLFALPWAFVAAFYAANGTTDWGKMGWILLAMVAARSAAMAFNRAADARLDAENPRTKMRAIPAGKLSVGFTLAFAVVMVGLLVLAAWRLNPSASSSAPSRWR
jgi:4-hydroxybenzoate polyprenyltransferase